MRNNGAKYVIVSALLVSVVALSLGFAAFTRSLTIKASADVSGPNTFNVSLSTANNRIQTGTVTPTVSGATGSNATLSENKIENLKATFTGTGQNVKYSFYTYNASEFTAYLNSVVIGSKTCTAVTGTNQTYVNNACNDISLTVKAGTGTYTSSDTNISTHTVASGGAEVVEVTIAYAANGATADGDFSVSFGDVVLTYGSAD